MKRKLLFAVLAILMIASLVTPAAWAAGEVPPTITTGADASPTLSAGGICSVKVAAAITGMGSGDNTGVYYWIEYGETTDYGSETTHRRVYKTGDISVTLSGFDPDTTYHYRANIAFRDEGGGISHGDDATFRVNSPDVTSLEATNLELKTNGQVQIRFNGTIDNMGDAPVTRSYIEYGLSSTDYGYTTKEVNQKAAGSFYANVIVYPGVTYHFRAVLRNGTNYVYGADTTYSVATVFPDYGLAEGSVVIAGTDGTITDDAGITYDTDTDTLSVGALDAPTGRTATYIIAPSDAPDYVKEQADHILSGVGDAAFINTFLATDNNHIYITEGHVYVETQLIPTASNLTIEGSGIGSTIFVRMDSTDINVINASPDSQKYFLTLKNFFIDGNKANNVAGNGISIGANYWNVYLSYVQSQNNPGVGIIATGCKSISFDNVSAGQNNGDCLFLNGVWAFNVNGGYYGTSGLVGGSVAYTIHVDGGGEGIIRGTIVDGLDKNYGRSGIGVYSSSWVNIVGNYLVSHRVNGIELLGANSHLNITGNTIFNQDETAIRIVDTTDSIISSNVIDTSASYGIHEPSAAGNARNNIQNNNITNTISSPLNAISSHGNSTIVSGNTGYIAPGESCTYSFSITAGGAGTITAWQNPNAQDCLVKDVSVRLTAGDTDAANGDVGVVANATTTGTDIFADITCETAGIYYSYTSGDGGTQTKPIVLNAAGGANDYITFTLSDNDGSSVVGTVYVTLVGA